MTVADVTVVGAGAIGGFVGARLAAAGEDVLLVDVVPEHVRAIRESGLHVHGAETVHAHPRACHLDELEGELGTVLLAVKARHTNDALASIAPLLAADGCVVSLQNGLEERRIARVVGGRRTVGAFLTFGGHYEAPGKVVFGGHGSFCIGELDGSRTPRIQMVARLLGRAHPVAVSDRIFCLLWGKTALESFYFASALADADVLEILDREELLPVFGALVAEASQVAEAEGSPCESIDGFDPRAFVADDRLAVRASWEAQRRYWRAHTATRTGIWRDLAVHQRPTEIDAILGPVLEAAEEHAVGVPHLRRLVELTHDVEAGRRPLGWATLRDLESAA